MNAFEVFANAVSAHEEGQRALKYFLNRWIPPSESAVEEAINKGAKAVAEAILEGRLTDHPLALLATLQRYQPVTQKLVHFERTPGFLEANEAWERALLKVLLSLSPGELELLPAGFRRKVYRARALERYPRAEIWTVDSDYMVGLIREGQQDKWYVKYVPGGADPSADPISGVYCSGYFSAGHLSPRRLSLRAVRRETADAAVVISVVVTHDHDAPCHQGCQLPAAVELVIRGGHLHWSPWQLRVDSSSG